MGGMTLKTSSDVSTTVAASIELTRTTYWSDTGKSASVMFQVNEPSLGSLSASVWNGPTNPVEETSSRTLPENPSARQRTSNFVFWGKRSPPLGFVTTMYCAGLLDACGVLPYAP